MFARSPEVANPTKGLFAYDRGRMKTRIIYTKVWKDGDFAEFSDKAKLLFLYLITNDKINLIGCYEITDREIMFDLGFSKGELAKIRAELSEKVVFLDGWVLVKNHDKYNNYSGSKNETAKLREIEHLPSIIKNQYTIDTVSTFGDTLINHNHKSEIINKKSKTINQESEINSIDDVKSGIRDLLEKKSI